MKLIQKVCTVKLFSILILTPLYLHADAGIEEQLGKYEYTDNCAVCHGLDGKGKGPMARQLIKVPKDLTLLSKDNGGLFPETEIYQLIDGRKVVFTDEGRAAETFHGPPDMPIWGDEFRAIEGDDGAVDERINNLIEYLKSIQAE